MRVAYVGGILLRRGFSVVRTAYIYRVIDKSLRDFRPLRYSSRDGHAEGEHANRNLITGLNLPRHQGWTYRAPVR